MAVVGFDHERRLAMVLALLYWHRTRIATNGRALVCYANKMTYYTLLARGETPEMRVGKWQMLH